MKAEKLTVKQLKDINRVAELLSADFIVSEEDGANPMVKVTKDKVYIYAGHALEDGEYVQQLYRTVELNKHDIAELTQDAAGWLLAEVFYTHFLPATQSIK